MVRRICTEVITQMLDKIPKENVDFVKALNWNFEDASYKPIEETIQWERTSETLQKFIPYPPTEKWQKEVLAIFINRTVEEVEKIIEEDSNL